MKTLSLMVMSILLCVGCHTENYSFLELTGERTYVPYDYKVSWAGDKPFDGDPRIIEKADDYIRRNDNEREYFLSDKIVRMVFDEGKNWIVLYTHENSLIIHSFSLILTMRKSDLIVVDSTYGGRSDMRGPIE